MKPKANRKRRAGDGFHAVHPTGYIVRYERARDGGWGAKPDALLVLSCGDTLKQTKSRMSEGIQLCIEAYAEDDLEMPKPEYAPTLVHPS